MRKRFLCIVLVFVFVMAVIPLNVLLAEENKRSEVTDYSDYTKISTKEELNAVRKNLSGKYVLTSDIIFNEADFTEGGDFYNNGAGWQPIGDDLYSSFSGIFDGNGHTISGLKINIVGDTSFDNFGLFDRINSGTVKNIGIINYDISVKSTVSNKNICVGAIAGHINDNSNIINCYGNGTINAISSGTVETGGLVGLAYDSTISNCYNNGEINAISNESDVQAGGIVGSQDGTGINNCYNTGAVNATSSSSSDSKAGGIAGEVSNYILSDINSSIINCNNSGDVTVKSTHTKSSAIAGGIIGKTRNACEVTLCYNEGKISTDGQYIAPSGGIVGYIYNSVAEQTNITKCYNTGSVRAKSGAQSAEAGGIIGQIYADSIIISNCYNTGTISSTSTAERKFAFIGGIVGTCSYGTVATINYCYNVGYVNNASAYWKEFGGIAAQIEEGSVNNCFYLNNVAFNVILKGVSYGIDDTAVSCTKEKMEMQSTFSGFDFDTVWTMEGSTEYAYPEFKELEHVKADKIDGSENTDTSTTDTSTTDTSNTDDSDSAGIDSTDTPTTETLNSTETTNASDSPLSSRPTSEKNNNNDEDEILGDSDSSSMVTVVVIIVVFVVAGGVAVLILFNKKKH